MMWWKLRRRKLALRIIRYTRTGQRILTMLLNMAKRRKVSGTTTTARWWATSWSRNRSVVTSRRQAPTIPRSKNASYLASLTSLKNGPASWMWSSTFLSTAHLRASTKSSTLGRNHIKGPSLWKSLLIWNQSRLKSRRTKACQMWAVTSSQSTTSSVTQKSEKTASANFRKQAFARSSRNKKSLFPVQQRTRSKLKHLTKFVHRR